MFDKKYSFVIFLLPLFIFLGCRWIFPISSKQAIQHAFVNVQAPIYNSICALQTFKHKIQCNLINKQQLITEYEKLLRANLYLKMRISDLRTAASHQTTTDTDRYDIDARFELIYANVVRRDLAAWASYVIINKGRKDGVHVGDGVISGHNVVGRIKELYRDLAIVELISSPTFKTSACLENDTFPIIYHGNGSNVLTKYSGTAENIVSRAQEAQNNKVRLVSSYLSGIFPGGLTIGYIDNIADIPNRMFSKATVELDANFINSLSEVTVLTQQNPEK